MDGTPRGGNHARVATVMAAVIGMCAWAQGAAAQGCMPLKFVSPSFAGLQAAYLRPHEWEIGISARRVPTNRFFSGTSQAPDSLIGGPLRIRLNSLDLSFTYAVSGRVSFTATVPFSYSTVSQVYADGIRRNEGTGGVGDVNLMGDWWVFDPGSHIGGNLHVGMGLKAPTGSIHGAGDSYNADGTISQWFLPQTVQPGDGGWAILTEAQGYQQIVLPLSVYVSAEYSASLRQHTDVIWPNAGVEWAVPDVYSLRSGLSYVAFPERGLSLSLGWRMDGTMTSDIFHPAGDYFRHAGYYMFVEPGASWIHGLNQLTLTVPLRVRADYVTVQTSTGPRLGAGGVPDYILYLAYVRRF